jgi:hypothetical protein
MSPDVLWIVEQDSQLDAQDLDSLSHSTMASKRMRVATPAAYLALHGQTQAAHSLQSDEDFHTILAKSPRTVVFSKILATSGMTPYLERYERLFCTFLDSKTKVIVDVCDNYFLGPAAAYLGRMMSKATVVVANSEATADLIFEHTGAKSTVIGDPAETAWGVPGFPSMKRGWASVLGRRQSRPLQLLWYGGPLRSFEPLLKLLPRLVEFSERQPISLHLVSAPFADIEGTVERFNQSAPHNFRLTFRAWNRQDLGAAISAADLVLLPGDPGDPSRTGASANRLIDAIWAGRYVVASGIPSYWEFRHAASIGEDLIAHLDWALSHPQLIVKRIEAGQNIIRERYTPAAIGRAWQAVLKNAA